MTKKEFIDLYEKEESELSKKYIELNDIEINMITIIKRSV